MKSTSALIGILSGLAAGLIVTVALMEMTGLAHSTCIAIGIAVGTVTTFIRIMGWHKAAEAFRIALSKADINEEDSEELILIAKEFCQFCVRSAGSFIANFVEIPRQLKNSAIARKKVSGFVVLIFLALIGFKTNSFVMKEITHMTLPFSLAVPFLLVWVCSIAAMAIAGFVLSAYGLGLIFYLFDPDKRMLSSWNTRKGVSDRIEFFFIGWLYALLAYEGSACEAVAHMLKVRTANVGRVFVFPFIYVWALLLVSDKKVRLSTAVTFLLLSVNFGVSHRLGWLESWRSANFLLSSGAMFAIGLLIGGWIDRRSATVTELPELELREGLYDFFFPMEFKAPKEA